MKATRFLALPLLAVLSVAADDNKTQDADINSDKILELQKQIPKCAIKCIANTAQDHGCNLLDLPCQCKKMQPIIQDVAPCVVKAGCGLDDIANTGQTVLNLCDEVGVSPENITSNAEAEGDTFQEDGAVSLLKSGWTAAAFGLVASALLLM